MEEATNSTISAAGCSTRQSSLSKRMTTSPRAAKRHIDNVLALIMKESTKEWQERWCPCLGFGRIQ